MEEQSLTLSKYFLDNYSDSILTQQQELKKQITIIPFANPKIVGALRSKLKQRQTQSKNSNKC